MKTLISAFKSSVVALFFGLSIASVQADGELIIYDWFEYFPDDLVKKFEAEHGIEVKKSTFDSNEALLATLKATGLGTYDLAVPGDYMVKILTNEGLLDTIGENELANRGNIKPQWVDVEFDSGRKHSVPYQWGSTSFAVNREVYSGDINTTEIIFDPPEELTGKINVLDSQGDVLTFAALHLGMPQCSTDREQLKALNDLVQNAKVHWASFNSETAREVLSSGDAAVGMIWNGFAARSRIEDNAPIEYAYPKQGMLVWMDNYVLLKDAPNRANAIKFLDFILEPENSATATNYNRYSSAITGVEEFLDPGLSSQPETTPPADAPAGTFVEVCEPQVQEVYDRIWANLKK